MNKNDQRITAYALGELRGAERDAFEADLAASEDLQREFKETLEMIEKIGNLPLPTEGLSEVQRVALRDECQKNVKIVRHSFRTRRMILVGTIGMVACVAIGVMVLKTDQSAPLRASGIADPRPASASPQSLASLQADAKEKRERVEQLKGEVTQLREERVMTDAAPAGPPQEVRRAKAIVLAEKVPDEAQKLNELKKASDSSSLLGAQQPLLDAVEAQSAPADKDSGQFYAKLPPGSVVSDQIATGGMPQTATAAPAPAPVDQLAQLQSKATTSGGARFGSGNQADAATVQTRTLPQGTTFANTEDYFADSPATLRRSDGFNTATYNAIVENAFLTSKENPLSTFSIDVDTASYANVRRFLQAEQLPPLGAVRIEELINYFPYAYPQPEGKVPFSVNVEVSQAPWNAEHQLARIALKGREVAADKLPPSNLVFLIDVSGSMDAPERLPLLKRSLAALVEQLRPQDHVAIVVYAGKTGLVLPSTSGEDRARILEALERLRAGGSTNGGAGIKLAYETAKENFIKGGNNRVILCTDGDFNVGVTSVGDLVKLIEKERESGVFLSALGFGTDNLKDATMLNLADKGNGNYSYIDSFSEGRKVLVEQMAGTLFTIAKDVKIQVEFNPAKVAGYRLIGYEKRLLAKEDFNNDKKDAGEIGSGHTVTALYEIVPAGMALPDQPSVDALKYQTPAATPAADEDKKSAKVSDELFTVKLRYKAPDGDKSELVEVPVASGADRAFDKGTEDFQFAAAVAAFGMKLRGSKYVGDISWQDIQKIARRSLGEDAGSYRAEFLTLVEKASKLREFQPKPDRSE